eukprot:CAMPEP_0176437238 /NCGR_PEP_ID=MMETSP0127-20121128/18489_1 /TAXON_ID=938130 /ORGANISM="Platyophrya macrostoma, Strain WH" /LENGTH=152 /DNA_ID=CAMNT_0017820799 /DNA_START=28 /DNA_END=483 /DNA_ORIENTATION=-
MIKSFSSVFKKYKPVSLFNSSKFFAGDSPYGHVHKPPKVADHIVWINVITDGRYQRLAGFEGETLLTVLQRYNVEGLPATCGGGEDQETPSARPVHPSAIGPMCGACHVIIDKVWYSKLEPPHELETHVIEQHVYEIHATSRLACTIEIEKW